jgi:hypothetical protein
MIYSIFITLFNVKSYIFSSNLMILNSFKLKHKIYRKNKYMKRQARPAR